MAVVDILISKTFDASLICPAEQTCVIDEAIYDELVAEFQRMGARLLTEDETARLGRGRDDAGGLDGDGGARPARASTSPRSRGSAPTRRTRCCWRRCRRTSTSSATHPFIAEKLMPVLGLVRSPSVRARHRRVRAGDRARRAGPHLRGLRARRGRHQALLAGRADRADPRQRADRGRRPRRRLQLDDADLLAGLRHLGRLDDHRQRQLPQPPEHQDRLAPAGAAAVVPRPLGHVLQPRVARQPARAADRAVSCSSPTPTPSGAASPTRCAATCRRAPRCTSSPGSRRSRPRRRSGRACAR